MGKSGIYTITCLVNKKIYVGYATDLYDRKSMHFAELSKNIHKNTYLQSSYNKHGKDNFIFEILVECPINLLASEEHYWCTILDTHNPEFGYNIQPTNPNGRITHSPETIEKIRKSLTGRPTPLSEQGKLNKINAQKNRIRTKEEIEKVAKKRRIPIISLNLKGEFIKEYISAREAAKCTGSDYRLISMNCKGKRKSTNGYIFIFKKDYSPDKNHCVTSLNIPVEIYDTDNNFIREFNTIREAAKYLNRTETSVSTASIKGYKCNGYRVIRRNNKL